MVWVMRETRDSLFSFSHAFWTRRVCRWKSEKLAKTKSKVCERTTQRRTKKNQKKNVAPGSLVVSVRVRSEDDDDENVFFYHLSDHVLFASEC